MKKCIALLLALLLCFALCACGEGTDTQPSQPTQGSQATKPSQDKPDDKTTTPSAEPTQPSTAPHEHSYTSVVTPPTCTEKGYTTYTCACGDSYTADQVDVVEHDYQETARVEATSNQDGSVTYTCSFCGDAYTEVLNATGSIGLAYEHNSDGTLTVVGLGTCTDSHVVIPAYVDGVKVTAIGRRAFYDCSTITEITIPETISEIGQQIFYKCSALHTVYYNGTYGNYENPFLNVANIKKVVFGGKNVPEWICCGLKNIEEVVILDGVTQIGETAFSDCSSLTSITIPNSVTSIGGGAFGRCTSLTSVVIPDGVSRIGNHAFSYCSSLTNVVIPGSVTSIGAAAFRNCS